MKPPGLKESSLDKVNLQTRIKLCILEALLTTKGKEKACMSRPIVLNTKETGAMI